MNWFLWLGRIVVFMPVNVAKHFMSCMLALALFEPQGATPQALMLFGGSRFITWCPFLKGMPTRPEAFLRMLGVSGLRPCTWTYLKNGLVPLSSGWWDVQASSSMKSKPHEQRNMRFVGEFNCYNLQLKEKKRLWTWMVATGFEPTPFKGIGTKNKALRPLCYSINSYV